jgi:hypothetical protein
VSIVLIEATSEKVFKTSEEAHVAIQYILTIPRITAKPYHSWFVVPDPKGVRTVMRFEPDVSIAPEDFPLYEANPQRLPLLDRQRLVMDSL